MSASLIVSLPSEHRHTKTRGQVRHLRQNGWIPANVYGGGASVMLQVPVVPFMKELAVRGIYTRIFELEGVGRVVVREMQFPAIKDIPLHIDFMRLTQGARVVLSIPVRPCHEDLSPGIKRGGILNVVHHTLQLSVSAQNIPQEVWVNLKGLDIGKSIYLKDLVLPEGTKVLGLNHEDAIVSIVSPAGLVEELRKDEATATAAGK